MRAIRRSALVHEPDARATNRGVVRGAVRPHECGMRSGRRRSSARLLAALLLAPCACKDDRISLDALRELEAQARSEAAAQDVTPIEAAELALVEWRPYRVGPRDVLQFVITGLDLAGPTGSFRARVQDDGNVRLPLVGPVQVAGMDLSTVEQTVLKAYVPDYVKDATVFVEVATTEPTTVLVQGAVGTPGLVTLKSNERNVIYALGLAGGWGAGASGRVTVRPVRPGREEVTYNFARTLDIRRAMLSPPLESGDVIVVEAAPPSAIYVLGLVNAPGPIGVPPNASLSLTRAIATAGGPIDLLEPKEATLWRVMPDGEQVRVKIDLDDVLAGRQPDVELRPGDILDVPNTPETRFRHWIVNNIRLGPFSVSTGFDPVAEWRFRRALDEDDDRFRGGGFGRSAIDNVLFGLPNVIIPPVIPTTTTP